MERHTTDDNIISISIQPTVVGLAYACPTAWVNAVHCGVSMSELCSGWYCIGSITATHNTLHVCNVYTHDKKNLSFMQIHAVAIRVERSALSLLVLH